MDQPLGECPKAYGLKIPCSELAGRAIIPPFVFVATATQPRPDFGFSNLLRTEP
jgi:hypothetical protein